MFLCVCLSVRVLKGNRLELSTPRLIVRGRSEVGLHVATTAYFFIGYPTLSFFKPVQPKWLPTPTVWWSVKHQWLCVSVCHCVRALKEKTTEPSAPNLVDIRCIAVTRHALTLRSKGHRWRSHVVIKWAAGMGCLHMYPGRYDYVLRFLIISLHMGLIARCASAQVQCGPLTKGLEPQIRPTASNLAPHSSIRCCSTQRWSGNCQSSSRKSTGWRHTCTCSAAAAKLFDL